MPQVLVIVVVVAALIVATAAVLCVERYRRNRRFTKKLSPYERRRSLAGQIVDPDDWPTRR